MKLTLTQKLMNKNILHIVFFTLLFTNCYALSFTDLNSYNENYKSVSNLFEKGIIKGFSRAHRAVLVTNNDG